MTTATDSYEQDFHAWTQQQATLLKAGRLDELDSEHLAEELESMGGSERQALSSRLIELLLHLLKWTYQPERRGSRWVHSINKQRIGIDVLLEESPSLQAQLSLRFDKAYQKARRYAVVDTRFPIATFPEICPFTLEQVLDPEFWPV